jgi:nucleoside-diphosphate-sugar epimerase
MNSVRTGKVYLTGVAGQIGAHLGRYLRKRGFTVTGVDLDEPPADSCDDFHQIDIADQPGALAATLAAQQFDSIVHLAAIVGPTEESDARLFSSNVLGTFNLTKAAERAGSPRLVFMSSESVLGFAFSGRSVRPLFVPIDESHPLRAHDAYGLSKILGERTVRAYGHATGAPVVSLRPPWVWIPEKVERYTSLVRNPAEWAHSLWAYIVIDDLNELTERALSQHISQTHAFYAAATDNGTETPSRQLLRDFYGFEGPYRDGIESFDAVISSSAARHFFDWTPRWTWRTWLPTVQHTSIEAEK